MLLINANTITKAMILPFFIYSSSANFSPAIPQLNPEINHPLFSYLGIHPESFI